MWYLEVRAGAKGAVTAAASRYEGSKMTIGIKTMIVAGIAHLATIAYPTSTVMAQADNIKITTLEDLVGTDGTAANMAACFAHGDTFWIGIAQADGNIECNPIVRVHMDSPEVDLTYHMPGSSQLGRMQGSATIDGDTSICIVVIGDQVYDGERFIIFPQRSSSGFNCPIADGGRAKTSYRVLAFPPQDEM